MDIKYKISCGILTVYIYGELDEHTSKSARTIIDELILNNCNVKRVVFDLSGVSFMDSTGIGLLLGRYKKIKEYNLPVNITGASFSAEKVLQLSGIYSVMPKF